jgi:hypothetical protein
MKQVPEYQAEAWYSVFFAAGILPASDRKRRNTMK